MLMYMLTAHARTRTCPVLLQLTRQEADELGGVDGLYLDRKGVKKRTGLSASAALSSAPGSSRSSLETNPVARIASPSSPRFAACSASASESLYRSRTMHSD
jgi:hypothetical protein